ncbi:MAG: phage holin family protein [Oscillibacter sp.]|nr:phage holin family protein [Oscillibacter sp.]
MDFGIASVAAITVLCYLIGQIVKATGIDNKWIPCIAGVVGAILGAVALRCGMPDFPATDYITAIAVGVVSGLAAVGINQVAKQLAGGAGNE